MQIAITASLVANGGDAAILLGTLRALEAAFGDTPTYRVYDGLPDVARSYYPELEVRPALYRQILEDPPRNRLERTTRFIRWILGRPRWYAAARAGQAGKHRRVRALIGGSGKDALAEYAQHDLVLASGGTYFVETYWLGPQLFDFSLTRQLGTPFVLGSQSLGPFRKRTVRKAMQRVLQHASLVLVRDGRSRRHVLDVAPEARVEIRADAAFALAEPDVLQAARTRTLPMDRPLRVAISVRDWPYFATTSAATGMRRFREAIAQLVTHLLREHSAGIVFVSTCQGLPAYRYDDSRVAEAIVALLPAEVRDRATVETGYMRPEAIMAETAACDLVVATRMHMAILSLCAGTPVLPIAYEFKTHELFKRLGMEERVQDIETVTGDALITATRCLLADLPTARADLFARVEAERADAMTAGIRVREVLEGGP